MEGKLNMTRSRMPTPPTPAPSKTPVARAPDAIAPGMAPHQPDVIAPDAISFDEHTLSMWMQSHGDAVLRTAALLLGDRHLAEDVCQETFLIAYQKGHQLMDVNRVRSWLVQIAVNQCRQRMRRSAWSRLVFREKIDEAYATPDPSPEERITIKSTLMDSIGQLPFKYREVIALFYYQSLSIEQISEVLDETTGTIKSRLSRAKNQLREIMREDEWFDE